MLAAVVLALALQDPATQIATSRTASNGAPPRAIANAARATTAPEIDGRDADEVWRQAVPITEFQQWQPAEGGTPRHRTEAKIAYDERHIYVFVRAFDSHPDSIPSQLARRDTWTPADKIWVMIDSYHDRRSGFEFSVNPSGVKFDLSITDDGNEDDAWDAVWDVATTIDSLGWTAEFRFPLSQLRYAPAESNTFGLMIMRDHQRYGERDSWPLLRRSVSGYASQFGELHGLVGLGSPRRLEAMPYVVSRNVPIGSAADRDHETQFRLGGDLKYGITPNITLDATFNPDFGQVEADPSVLNLSAFETFFQERRPFFVEGTGIWRFDVNCSVVNCSGENLFYSRRIGRSPTLSYGEDNEPTNATILGAAKISGRLGNGLSIGVLDAVTRSEESPSGLSMEPMTNYHATRLTQDFRQGQTSIGGMITHVQRDLDTLTEDVLHNQALVGAMDFRHQFANRRYTLSGSLAFSRVSGTAQAIAGTQTSAVHFYQRPDDGVAFDPTRTTLTGNAQEIKFGKFGGRLTRFETSFQRRSSGFDVNDLGFLRRADQQSWNNWFALQWNQPSRYFNRANWNFNWWQYWTTDGLPTERAFNTNVHAQFKNKWWLHTGFTLSGWGSTYCDFDCTRGGPATRRDRGFFPWLGLQGDDRWRVYPELWINYGTGDDGRSSNINIEPFVRVRLSPRLMPRFSISYFSNRDDLQARGRRIAGADTSYIFAALRQTQISVNLRLDYTFTPTLSLQMYAAPFVSKGTYSNIREVADARNPDYDARFASETNPAILSQVTPGFNFKAFNSNVVLRWEFRPGSTMFVVWNQGRGQFLDAEGAGGVRDNFTDIYRLRPDNVFLVKFAYWLSW